MASGRGCFPSRRSLSSGWLHRQSGEREYVTRYDAYAGYAFLDSPHIGLFENGFALQAGFRPKTWYSFGFDNRRMTGDTTLTPDLLPSSLQQP